MDKYAEAGGKLREVAKWQRTTYHSGGRRFDPAGLYVIPRPRAQGAAPCPAWHGWHGLLGVPSLRWWSEVADWSAMLQEYSDNCLSLSEPISLL